VDIGKALQSRIKEFFDSPLAADATPLEITQAVLEELELKVQPVGRGRRVFPYNQVLVRIGPTAADRPAMQAACDALPERLRERLGELRCAAPDKLEVRTTFLKRAPTDWQPGRLFAVECRSEVDVSTEPLEDLPLRTVHVSVVKGSGSQETYSFSQSVISIGRTAEPTDDRGRVRRNDVIFLDAVDGITETVGRAHARLQFEPKTREYRIFNEGSSNPTFILRDGTSIQIPARDPRGVRVCSGDEIQLGRAVIRLAFEAG
jgi:hypothetical protein